MTSLASLYKERLNLQQAKFTFIDHEDAMVAIVFKVTLESGKHLILKVCSRTGDYLREVYFLNLFAEQLPVPRIIQLIPPETNLHGAVLMECLSGELLTTEDLNDKLAHEIGSLLGHMHLERVKGYGDLTDPTSLSTDPRVPFTMKFEEGLEECSNHLPTTLLQKCRQYYDQHIDALNTTDGPCIIHRDFRPGNIIIDQGKIRGIIDWSSARGGFAEEDFCPLEFGEWSTHSSYNNSFLAGYASIRKVPDYHCILPLLRLSRAIGAIGFTVKSGTWQGKGSKIYQFNRQYLESFLEA
ncbi:MAG TPA: aminoglycoside phosphotransferase family protein [Rhabdochlamydiaceae bacterium]|nr:aminoglycoside phosphotransferase family protein [Rhabdochlamydiaceae bacterium]